MKLSLVSRKKDPVRNLTLQILGVIDIVSSTGLILHEEMRLFEVDRSRLKDQKGRRTLSWKLGLKRRAESRFPMRCSAAR